MTISLQKQINIIAEKTYDNNRNISEKDKQRRNQVVDLFGIELTRNSHPSSASSSDIASLYVSISQDLIYYERFQFKMYFQSETATDVQILVRTRVKQPDDTYQEEDIDITPYLIAQYPDDWIDHGREEPYPNDAAIDDNAPNAYDILEVISDMYAEGNDNYASALERPEYKRFIVKANGEFFCAMVLYLKYSHLNR